MWNEAHARTIPPMSRRTSKQAMIQMKLMFAELVQLLLQTNMQCEMTRSRAMRHLHVHLCTSKQKNRSKIKDFFYFEFFF